MCLIVPPIVLHAGPGFRSDRLVLEGELSRVDGTASVVAEEETRGLPPFFELAAVMDGITKARAARPPRTPGRIFMQCIFIKHLLVQVM